MLSNTNTTNTNIVIIHTYITHYFNIFIRGYTVLLNEDDYVHCT